MIDNHTCQWLLYRFSQIGVRQAAAVAAPRERLIFLAIKIVMITNTINATEPMTIPTIALFGKELEVWGSFILREGSVML